MKETGIKTRRALTSISHPEVRLSALSRTVSSARCIFCFFSPLASAKLLPTLSVIGQIILFFVRKRWSLQSKPIKIKHATWWRTFFWKYLTRSYNSALRQIDLNINWQLYMTKYDGFFKLLNTWLSKHVIEEFWMMCLASYQSVWLLNCTL